MGEFSADSWGAGCRRRWPVKPDVAVVLSAGQRIPEAAWRQRCPAALRGDGGAVRQNAHRPAASPGCWEWRGSPSSSIHRCGQRLHRRMRPSGSALKKRIRSVAAAGHGPGTAIAINGDSGARQQLHVQAEPMAAIVEVDRDRLLSDPDRGGAGASSPKAQRGFAAGLEGSVLGCEPAWKASGDLQQPRQNPLERPSPAAVAARRSPLAQGGDSHWPPFSRVLLAWRPAGWRWASKNSGQKISIGQNIFSCLAFISLSVWLRGLYRPGSRNFMHLYAPIFSAFICLALATVSASLLRLNIPEGGAGIATGKGTGSARATQPKRPVT